MSIIATTPNHGYAGPMPKRGEKAFNHFHGNKARDGQGHGLEDYSWHCKRHTFASRLVKAGVDLRIVAELLGHRTLRMVMRYSHLAPEHSASAVDRLVVKN